MKVFVSDDATAIALGADATAGAIAAEAGSRGLAVEVVRNGSRSSFWLEPVIEVQTPAGRLAYGPVAAGAVAGLFDAGLHAPQRTRSGLDSPKTSTSSRSRTVWALRASASSIRCASTTTSHTLVFAG